MTNSCQHGKVLLSISADGYEYAVGKKTRQLVRRAYPAAVVHWAKIATEREGKATSYMVVAREFLVGEKRELATLASMSEIRRIDAMHNAERCALSFSGGKDSTLALDRAIRQGFQVDVLVTLYDEASQRVRFHGVPITLIQAQARALGIPLLEYPTTPETFEAVFLQALHDLLQQEITTLIFGNIHLADVRAWYEERTQAAGLLHREPLWGEPPEKLVREFLVRGYAAVLTCIEEAHANPDWLGAPLTEELIQAFEQAGIDPCGERGEYHTFVYAGSLFSSPLAFRLGERISLSGFQLIDIQEQPDQ